MTSDRYTKAVLTVIAGCLLYICIALTPGPAVSAQTNAQEVVIVGWKRGPGDPKVITLPGAPSSTSAWPLPVTTQ